MKSIPVLDYTSTLIGSPLPDLVDGNGTVQEESQTYTLADGDAPTVLYRYVPAPGAFDGWMADGHGSRLFTGTPVLYIDLVTANATLGFQPTITKRGNGNDKHHFSGYHWLHRNNTKGDSFSSVPVLGNLYEADYLQRK